MGGADRLVLRQEMHRDDIVLVFFQERHLVASCNIPDTDGVILAATDDLFSTGRDVNAENKGGVAFKAAELLSRCKVKKAHRAVIAADHQLCFIAGECDGPGGVGGPIDVAGGPGNEEGIFGIMRVIRIPAFDLAVLGGGGFDMGDDGSSRPGGRPRGRRPGSRGALLCFEERDFLFSVGLRQELFFIHMPGVSEAKDSHREGSNAFAPETPVHRCLRLTLFDPVATLEADLFYLSNSKGEICAAG